MTTNSGKHLRALGLIGWDHLEIALLAGLVRRKPILLEGMHGGNKTEGSKRLARAAVAYASKRNKDDADKIKFKFASFDAPLLTVDDLIGLLNPKTLGTKDEDGNDVLDFIRTPNSAWEADACLVDEITRADRGIAGKLMEYVRTGNMMGKPTALKQAFATANPPKEYDAIYMDLAFASRFMILRVPDARTMDESDFETVVQLGIRNPSRAEKEAETEAERRLGRLIGKARSAELTEAEEREALGFVKELRRILNARPSTPNAGPSNANNLKVSLRQYQEMAGTYCAILKLRAVGALGKSLNADHVAEAILAWVPETTGIVMKQVPRDTLRTAIAQLAAQLARGEIMTPMPLEEVIKAPAEDADAWGAAVVDAIGAERDVTLVAKAARISRVRAKKKKVTAPVVNAVISAAVERIVSLCRQNLFENEYAQTPVSYDRSGLIEAIGSLIEIRKAPKALKNPPKNGVFYHNSFATTDDRIRSEMLANMANGGGKGVSAQSSTKLLFASSDKNLKDQRVFGAAIPIVALSKAQHARMKAKISSDHHVVMVYTSPSDPKDVIFVEMYEDSVRVIATAKDLLIQQGDYREYGVHFLWNRNGTTRFADKAYTLTAIMVNPTCQDLVDAGVLPYFMNASSPDPLCTRKVVNPTGQRYIPDFAKLYPSDAEV
jgi:MoxR-like ATPase